MIRRLTFLFLLLGTAGAVADDMARTEVPITQVTGANGRSYYFIAVTVGNGAPFQALLDTGSAGLRLLPGLVAPQDVTLTGHESRYGYSTGSQFTGQVGRARIGIGSAGTATPARVQMIDGIGCRADRADCPAAGKSLDDFGFGDEGLSGPAQRARIGISLHAADDADNPLALIGNGQWIIELPRLGDDRPGRLILNPAAQEMAGFSRVRLDRSGDLPGCVVNADTGEQICGQLLPDTGGNGLAVEARQRPASFPWPEGVHATLAMESDNGPVTIPFQVRHVPGTPAALHWEHAGAEETRIAGVLPFLVDAVLFDARAHAIGFKPR